MKNQYFILLTFVFLMCLSTAYSQNYYALDFVENKGQWKGDFKFKSTIGDGSIFISSSGYTVLMHNSDDYASVIEAIHGHGIEKIQAPVKITSGPEVGDDKKKRNPIPIRSHAYQMQFVGANRDAVFVPEKPTGEVSNYFLGADPANWKTDVGSYGTIIAKEIYPGVDIKYYSSGDQLKYDLLLQPGADLSQILLRYDGVDKMSIRDGQLILKTSVRESKELEPYAYQIIDGKKIEINCSYSLKDNQVSFKVRGYDKSAPLIIDPELDLSTYTGSKVSNFGFTAAPGPDGSLYAGGIFFGTGYPIKLGSFPLYYGGGTGSDNNNGGIDIGITRFSTYPPAVGRPPIRIFSTYLGSAGKDYPHSIYVDPAGNPVILGRTTDGNGFPTVAGNRIGPLGATDIFITKLSADGRVLLGGVVVGGTDDDGVNIDEEPQGPTSLIYNYADNARSEVVLDKNNNVYVAASTSSKNIFLTNNNLGGKQDGLVMKFSPNLDQLLYHQYIGGTQDDAAFVLAINPINNDVYVAGATASTNFPGNKESTIGPDNAGGIDGFIAMIDNNTGNIKKSTYLGTKRLDIIYGIQFDALGFPYVMGISLGDWKIKSAPGQSSIYKDIANNGQYSRQFISKLLPDLSDYVYSTVFGAPASVPNISPVAFLVDRCENVYVSGWGGRLYLCYNGSFDNQTAGTRGMPVKGNPIIQSITDNRDFYFFILKKDGTEQLYGSFFGQQGGAGEHVDGGTSRFDNKGAIYQAMCANCGGRNVCRIDPVSTPLKIKNAVAPLNGALGSGKSGECNLAAFKITFEFDGVKAGLKSIINGVSNDTSGCVPLKVDFVDTMALGKKYIFVYNDGSPNDTLTRPDISHIFTNTGLYRVMVIAINEDRCITRDTSYVNILVGSNKAIIKGRIVKELPCNSRAYKFINESEITPGIPDFTSDKSFVWDYGHDDMRDTVGALTPPPIHTFPGPGTYNVRLYLIDPNYCNQADFIEFVVRVSSIIKAGFETPPLGCVPYTAEFANTSIGGNEFKWFVDGVQFHNDFGPAHYDFGFNVKDNYDVMLVVNDTTKQCPLTDTFRLPVSVKPNPTAKYAYSPNPPRENTPVSFINQSLGAVSYLWDFGDGFFSNARDTSYIFQETGNFDVCLTAYSQFGCPDTYCDKVQALIYPLVDLPNAFTPNGDGINDVLYVKGYGVKSLAFRIYNRLGQVVFESTSLYSGWDGKFKGVLQPMDAYAYTLSVLLMSGEQVNKKGDITLIR